MYTHMHAQLLRCVLGMLRILCGAVYGVSMPASSYPRTQNPKS